MSTATILLGTAAIAAAVARTPQDPEQISAKAVEYAQRGEWAKACAGFLNASSLAPRQEELHQATANACTAAGERTVVVEALRAAWRLAVEQGAFDRVASYQHNALMALYVQPPWANEKRQAAYALPDSPAVQRAYAEYAASYGQAQQAIARGQGDVARQSAERALALAIEHFGAEHPMTGAAHNQVGDALRLLDDHEAARLHYERAIRSAMESYGPAHPDTLVYLNNLGSCDEASGNLAGARWAFERAYEGARTSLGEDNPVTLTYVNNLGNVVAAEGKRDRADRMLRAVLATKERLLGPDHFDPLTVRLNVALNEVARGQRKAAFEVLDEGLFTAYVTLGEDHPVTQGLVKTFMQVQGIELDDTDGLTRLVGTMLETRTDTAVALQAEGRWLAAEELLRRVLAVETTLLGPRHVNTLVTTSLLGDLMMVGGRYEEAEPLFALVLEGGRETFGARHENTITATGNLALLYEKQGKYKRAYELAEQAVELSREVRGPEDEATLAHENDLALIANGRGMFGRARELYESVLARRLEKLGASHAQTLRSMHNLAMFLLAQGEHARAQTLAEDALEGRQKSLGKTHPDTLLSLSAYGLVLFSRGFWGRAQQTWEEAWALRREHLGRDHPDTLNTMSDLAGLHIAQNRADRAEPLLEEVLRRRRELLGEAHPFTLVTLNDLATAYRMDGRFEEASKLYVAALEHAERTLGVDHPGVLPPLNNLAVLLETVGRQDEAVRLYERARELGKTAWGVEHPATLSFQSNLARALSTRGDHARAGPLLVATLEARRRVLGAEHPDTLQSLHDTAWHATITGDLDGAEALWEESLAASERFFERVLYATDQRTRMALLEPLLSVRDRLLSFAALRGTPRAARLVLAFSASRKGLTQRIAAELHALSRSKGNPETARLSQQLSVARSRLAELTLAGRQQRSAEEQAREQAKLARRLEELEIRFARAVGTAKTSRAPSAQQLIDALAPDEVLVDFLAYEDATKASDPPQRRLLAVIVDRAHDPEPALLSFGPFQTVEKQIDSLRAALRPPVRPWTRQREEVARALYRSLLKPVAKHLAGKRAVYLVPDGALHLLPFAALRDGDGAWAIETHPLVMLTTARDLVARPARTDGGAPVIVSAPDYGPVPAQRPALTSNRTSNRSRRDLRFVPLPGTAQEGTLLQGRLEGARHLSGGAATESALASAVEHPRVLHLATHGFFLGATHNQTGAAGTRGLMIKARPDDRPDTAVRIEGASQGRPDPLTLAGLALAGANRARGGEVLPDGSDGILTAMEALSLDLVGTELVVLSACETGVGDIDVAEGVYGLRRAFHQAGARAVISTLWSIDDAGTRAFMDDFYGRWLDGAAPWKAVAEAQRAMAKSERFAHPFYWAPFVASGKP